MVDSGKKILIVVSGMSPAVLTETVWALATGKPSVVPDEIVVLTTLTGRRAIEQQIIGGDDPAWPRMCDALKKKRVPIDGKLNFGGTNSIQIFGNGSKDLSDITTPEENTIAADFILKTIRAYSENPSTQIYASIAGGRKTMSALMLSCMSLLAREQDHVLHVLVNEPFDGAVEPRFYFPDGRKYVRRNGNPSEPIPSSAAKIDLIDLPFVKVRSLYENRFGERVPSYAELVQGAQLATASKRPHLKFDFETGRFFVGDEDVKLSETEFLALGVMVAERPQDYGFVAQRLCELHALTVKPFDSWLYRFTDGLRFTNKGEAKENLRKVLAALRKKLSGQQSLAQFVGELLPKSKCLVTYPKDRISADIQVLLQQFKKV